MRVRKNVKMSEGLLDGYRDFLLGEERSAVTVEKYLRDVGTFLGYMEEATLDRKRVLDYKQGLKERYKITSANSMLVVMSGFSAYLGREDLKVKLFKVQRALYVRPEREVTEKDHRRLIQAARSNRNETMGILIQTIGSTGVRTSELKFITVESLASERAEIYNKGRSWIVLLPMELNRVSRKYYWKARTMAGSIFITEHGNPMGRSNVSKKVRALGKVAGMDAAKVFPHSLRHLSVRISYSTEKDVVRLMDLLGHSNIGTTRTYIMGTEEQPRGQISWMKLVLGQSRQAEQ